ncbi:MAG: hypothetical protein R3F30_13005 [Planctomycetota bacterium]
MKLVALSLVRNEEYWVWYSLASVWPWVDEILLFDNLSEDRTVERARSVDPVGDKLRVFEGVEGRSEQDLRERCLERCREAGATHVLFLDGDEVHVDEDLALARRMLEVGEHREPLADPPRAHGEPLRPDPTDGVLLKNIGFKPVHPGFAGPDACIPEDHLRPDDDHSCYNYAIRISALANLHGNGLEWGRHGWLETGDLYVQASPHTLWCPGLRYFHFTHHPRSPLRVPGTGAWVRPVQDLGSVPHRQGTRIPQVLFRRDGPSNPTLEHWGLRAPARAGSRVAAPSASPFPA